MRHVIAVAAALATTGAGSAFGQSPFTPATGPACKDQSKEGFGLWTCPGPAGYVVRFADEGNIVSLTIAPRRAIEKVQGPTGLWRQGAVDHARRRSQGGRDPDLEPGR